MVFAFIPHAVGENRIAVVLVGVLALSAQLGDALVVNRIVEPIGKIAAKLVVYPSACSDPQGVGHIRIR